MAKIITKKSQIPQYARKNIKNFSKLTDNQAIYQYELNKLIRRAGGEYGQFLKGYYQMPERVYKKDIEEIRSLRNVKLRSSREKYETDRRIERITLDRIEYEQPRIDRPVIESPASSPDLPNTIIDINDLIDQEKQYKDPAEYLKETGQIIDPFTGEILSKEYGDAVNEKIKAVTDVSGSEDLRPEKQPVVNVYDSIENFLDQLEQYVRDEQDRAVVANSSYRSGRSRSQKSREWIEDNISKAGDMVLKEINRIRSSEDSIKKFAQKFSNESDLQDLMDAIGEYLMAAYHSSNTTGAFQSSRVYMILHDGPMTLADTMEFEDEE